MSEIGERTTSLDVRVLTHRHILNTTNCLRNSSPVIEVDYSVPTLLELQTDKGREFRCQWHLKLGSWNYYLDHVNFTIFDLPQFLFGVAKFSLEFVEDWEEEAEDFSVPELHGNATQERWSLTFHTRFWKDRHKTRIKPRTIPRFTSVSLHARESPVAYSVWVFIRRVEAWIVRQLPSVYHSDTSGYITSPRFLENDKISIYVGEFLLSISNDESVFITFPYFFLRESYSLCGAVIPFIRLNVHDTLNLTALNTGKTYTFCGPHRRLYPMVIPSSIKLRTLLRTTPLGFVGHFKVTFAVIPKSKEPEMVAEGLYNCSVPHFDLFKAQLQCNIVAECVGKEDEKNCAYKSIACGEDMIDHGTKCYRILPSRHNLNWVEASSRCAEKGLRLVTFPSDEEYKSLVNIMSKFIIPSVYIGLRQSPSQEPMMYKHVWRWIDSRTAFSVKFSAPDLGNHTFLESCAFFYREPERETMFYYDCFAVVYKYNALKFYRSHTIVCESDKQPRMSTTVIRLKHVALHTWNMSMTKCSRGHVTRDFMSCDVQSQCSASRDQQTCSVDSFQVPMFACQDLQRSIHYTLVCDYVIHCLDRSDEDFCKHTSCPLASLSCRNRQCFAMHKMCDGVVDCLDSTDEDCFNNARQLAYNFPGRGIVQMDGSGNYTVALHGKDTTDCPATHFLCPLGHCLPVFLRCNSIPDCVGREDEADCKDYICPGFYRCWGSKVCLHPHHVCDGIWHCPKHDDETLCDLHCPDVCHCQGLAFICSDRFNTASYPNLRFLDASGSGITLNDFNTSFYLLHLIVSRCGINNLNVLFLPNLIIFDLSWNNLSYIDVHTFNELANLKKLILANNPLTEITNNNFTVTAALNLHTVDLSNTSFTEYNISLSLFHNLKTLNLSNSKLSVISDEGFVSTPLLETLDMRGCPLETFPLRMLRDLPNLKFLYVTNYKLCCQSVLPSTFDPQKCNTKQDPLSSCEHLIKSGVFRIIVPSCAVLSTVGNMGSLVYRTLDNHEKNHVASLSMFVTNLALANFLMGLYLVVIAAADIAYRGNYLFHDNEWKHSLVCTAAGFVFQLSNQVSVLCILLITLDRVLAIRFTLSTVRFKWHSAMTTCLLMWAVGFVLAVVPVVSVTDVFDSSAMCIPLPFSRSDYFDYFDILVLLNFAMFTLVACIIAVIYWSLRSIPLEWISKDVIEIERGLRKRLQTVLVSDLICRFFVGLLGITSYVGGDVPDEVKVVIAIFVLPFNSVINPFLYIYTIVAEKRRKIREELLLKRLKTDMKIPGQKNKRCNTSGTEKRRSALDQINVWIKSKVVSARNVASCTLREPE